MRIFVLTATYELRVSRKSHLRDHPNRDGGPKFNFSYLQAATADELPEARS
jgi:hypothetical protein